MYLNVKMRIFDAIMISGTTPTIYPIVKCFFFVLTIRVAEGLNIFSTPICSQRVVHTCIFHDDYYTSAIP